MTDNQEIAMDFEAAVAAEIRELDNIVAQRRAGLEAAEEHRRRRLAELAASAESAAAMLRALFATNDAETPAPVKRRATGGAVKLPDGIMTRTAYSKRIGFSEWKSMRIMLKAGVFDGCLDEDQNVIVAKADQAVLDAFSRGVPCLQAVEAIVKITGVDFPVRSVEPEPEKEDDDEPDPDPEPASVHQSVSYPNIVSVDDALDALSLFGITAEKEDDSPKYLVAEPGQPFRHLPAAKLIEKAREMVAKPRVVHEAA